MHSKYPISCGYEFEHALYVALFGIVDQLCATKRFVDHKFKYMIGNLFCVSSMNHKPVCVSKNAKYDPQQDLWRIRESQIHCGFAASHLRRFLFLLILNKEPRS